MGVFFSQGGFPDRIIPLTNVNNDLEIPYEILLLIQIEVHQYFTSIVVQFSTCQCNTTPHCNKLRFLDIHPIVSLQCFLLERYICMGNIYAIIKHFETTNKVLEFM